MLAFLGIWKKKTNFVVIVRLLFSAFLTLIKRVCKLIFIPRYETSNLGEKLAPGNRLGGQSYKGRLGRNFKPRRIM
jgi:hypothetical protein